MNTNSIRNAIVAISVVLLLIYVLIPSIRPLFSYLVVIGLVAFTIKLTLDGIKIKRELKKEVDSLESEIKMEISNFYQSNTNNQQINRLALIDHKCAKNNKFRAWEKEKRYYQFLPNFLLSIGLFGTFTGITMNLFLIGINTGGKIDIQTILPDIISSMAIAFVSSLVALGCSMFLTKFHPTAELEMAKDNLLISLEHYLDNDLLLKQNLPTLTDKIDKLIASIDGYSTNVSDFHKSFPQITIDFKNSVTDAGNTLKTSANNFQTVVQQSSSIMQIAAKALSDATNDATGLTTTISDLISSLEITTNNLQKYTTNLDTVGKTLTNNSKQVQVLIESNEEKMIEVLNNILDNSQIIFTSTQSLNQNITQVTTSLNNHIVQIDQQSKVLYNLTVMIQKADVNINQVSGNLEKNTPLLDNQINKLQLLTSQLNQTTQVVYQVNGNLGELLNASQKSQQSNN
jgi:methyl-accepting chemotaxis protein